MTIFTLGFVLVQVVMLKICLQIRALLFYTQHKCALLCSE